MNSNKISFKVGSDRRVITAVCVAGTTITALPIGITSAIRELPMAVKTLDELLALCSNRAETLTAKGCNASARAWNLLALTAVATTINNQ